MVFRTSAVAALVFAGAAGASVTQYYGAQIQNPSGFATFTGYGYDPAGNPVTEGGMQFWMFGQDTSGYSGYNGDGYGYYSDGGGFAPTQIIRSGGGNFGALEFVAADGWGQSYNYGYAEALLGGVSQGTFDIEGNANSTVYGFSGGFDELRVAFFNNVNDRNQHNLNNYSAGTIDHVTWGGVPTPGAAAVLGLAGLTAGRRRR
jgi:MYXO-CTERM domain-containing protein